MDKIKAIIRWALVLILAVLALIYSPSLTSILFLAGAIVVLPIKPFDEFLKKIKITFIIRIVVTVILFVVGVMVIPGNTSEPTDNTKNTAAVTDDKDRKDDKKDSEPTETPNEPSTTPVARKDTIDDFYHGKVAPQPMFEVTEFGNFTEIDKNVFENAEFEPKDLVGRWYEDGWLEGYYLELYGNGTWRYFGEVERNGKYSVSYSLIVLEESVYGVDVCQPSIFYDDDDKAFEMSLTPTGPEAFETRTDSDDYVSFWREDGCRHCDDLDAYYENKYPYKELAGDWYPVGKIGGGNYFKITAAAHWADIRNHSALEVGVLEETGDGTFTSEGGTWEELRTFKLADDGYLYIDGEAYEKVVRGDRPPSRSIGTFCYDNGDGYIFNEDWTFESLSNSSFNERGTFTIIGSNVLLYDDNGNRLHIFYQDEFMDWNGERVEDAWRKRMENRDDSELYEESIYYQLPDED